MGTKRIGHARIRSLINKNQNQLQTRYQKVVTTSDAAKTLTAADSGALVILAQATASRVLTLPSVAAGLTFEICAGADGDAGSGAWVITPSDTDTLDGVVIGRTGTGVVINAADTLTADATIKMGDRVLLSCDGTTWFTTALVNDAGDWTVAG